MALINLLRSKSNVYADTYIMDTKWLIDVIDKQRINHESYQKRPNTVASSLVNSVNRIFCFKMEKKKGFFFINESKQIVGN